MFLFCSNQNDQADMGKIKDRQMRRQDRQAYSPATLGELAEARVNLVCWCNRCGHYAITDSALLAGQLGPHFPAPETGTQMRCSSCGSKDVATRPDWPVPHPVSQYG